MGMTKFMNLEIELPHWKTGINSHPDVRGLILFRKLLHKCYSDDFDLIKYTRCLGSLTGFNVEIKKKFVDTSADGHIDWHPIRCNNLRFDRIAWITSMIFWSRVTEPKRRTKVL